MSKNIEGENQEQLWKTLYDELMTREIERYEDIGTVSISFYSPMLKTSIQSGEGSMNFQAAIHQNSVTNKWRVTLGMPIITKEY
jgi:hypothetical protein